MLRMGVQEQRDRRVRRFGMEIAAFDAAFWAIDGHFWHGVSGQLLGAQPLFMFHERQALRSRAAFLLAKPLFNKDKLFCVILTV